MICIQPGRGCCEKPPKPNSDECAPQKRNGFPSMYRTGWYKRSKVDLKTKQRPSWWIAISTRPGLPMNWCHLQHLVIRISFTESQSGIIPWYKLCSYPIPGQAKFISSLEVVVKRRASQKVTIDEKWLTEKEMRDDYGWSTCFPYIIWFDM